MNCIHTTYTRMHVARSDSIHSHARSPHSMLIQTSAFAIIRMHSRQTAFSVHFILTSFNVIHFKSTFTSDSHSRRLAFKAKHIQNKIHSFSFTFIQKLTHSRLNRIHGCHGTFTGAVHSLGPFIHRGTHLPFIQYHSLQTAFIKYCIRNHTVSFSIIQYHSLQTAFVMECV